MRLALYQPDIPQNAGTILRLGACLGVAVDLIEPAGFDISDRALRRAGLDYLAFADIRRHASFADFMSWRGSQNPTPRLVLLSRHSPDRHLEHRFRPDDILLLGRESSGVPQSVHDVADARIRVPIRPPLRSLNIAVAAALVLGEALRQTGGFLVEPTGKATEA